MPAADPTSQANSGSPVSFPKAVRLRKSEEFKAVYSIRQSGADGLLIVNGRSNGLSFARMGLTVSRRVGNAVVRNRWKRCLREAFRQIRSRLPALDIVVTPRPNATPNVAEAMRSLESLVWKVEKRILSGAPPYEPRRKGKKPGRPASRQKPSKPGSNDAKPKSTNSPRPDSIE